MKTAIMYINDGTGHQPTWGHAFCQGLRRHGWQAEIKNHFGPADLIIMWGARRRHITEQQLRRGGQMCILERGYIGNRFEWCSVSFGGELNNRAEFRGPFTDGSRWQKNFAHLMKPWITREPKRVTIMGQVPGDFSVMGVNLKGFYSAAHKAYEAMGLEVKFRPHPLAYRTEVARLGIRKVIANLPIEQDLEETDIAVTYNSNSGVDAILAGIPTMTKDCGSMVWDLAAHDFVIPPKPDRTAWAHAIAWKQWKVEEMASGDCWAAIGERVMA